MSRDGDCSICGWRPIARGNRCASCRAFHRRHGRDRTPAEVLRNHELTKDRQLSIGQVPPEVRGVLRRSRIGDYPPAPVRVKKVAEAS